MAYAGVILFNKGKILLQLRDNNSNTRNPDLWGIFGGGIEKKETPEQAIIREIIEELGIKIEKPKLILKTEFKGETMYIFKQKLEDISNLKLNEGRDMKFFSKDEILKLNNVVPGIKELIKNHF